MQKRIAGLCVLFLLVCGQAFGQTLTIPPTINVDLGAWQVVTPKTDCQWVQWYNPDGLNLFPQSEQKNPNNAIFVGNKEGTYKLIAFAGNATGGTFQVCTVTVGVPVPPNPGPGPGPGPQPNPSIKNVTLVVIDDALARTVATANVLNDSVFWTSQKANGNVYFNIDKNALSPTNQTAYAPWIAKAGGVPALIILDSATNKPAVAVKLPSTSAEIGTMVKNLTGK
jgi:hypothetical protein